jgi:hypothetical protein
MSRLRSAIASGGPAQSFDLSISCEMPASTTMASSRINCCDLESSHLHINNSKFEQHGLLGVYEGLASGTGILVALGYLTRVSSTSSTHLQRQAAD